MDIHRLLLYIIFGCAATFIQVAAVGQKPKCHELPKGTVRMTTESDICEATSMILGHFADAVTLNFSQAEKKAFDLLTKGFNTISGAFVMDGNEHVETVNFASIITFDGSKLGKDSLFISIRNNPNLEKLTWDKNVTQLQIGSLGKDLYIYIYNNPQLDVTSFQMIENKVAKESQLQGHFQKAKNECRFQHPFDAGSFATPPDDVLKNCKNIEGDMKMDGGSLAGLSLVLNSGACLKLIGVNMTGTQISLRSGALLLICKDSVTKSEIKNNPGLCGDDLVKLMGFFGKTAAAVAVEPHESCAAVCNGAQAVSTWHLCTAVTQDADITTWFTDPAMMNRPGHLTRAAGLTIADTNKTTIRLPLLAEVNGLTIRNNSKLVDLELPLLTKINGKLTITGSDKLLYKKIKDLYLKITQWKKDQFDVECVMEADDVFTDLKDLKLCTVIKGPLHLKGFAADISKTDFHITRIEGCVTVEDTQMTTLDFLLRREVWIGGCTGEHLFKNNSLMCPPGQVATAGNENITAVKPYKEWPCGKICDTVKFETDCVILNGELDMQFKYDLYHSQHLQVIYGYLMLDDSPFDEVELPNLMEVISPTAPAIQIVNNTKLENVTLPKLRLANASDGGKPLLLVRNNPRMLELSGYLLTKCQNFTSDVCDNDMYVLPPEPSWWEALDVVWKVAIIAVPLLLLFVIAVAIAIPCIKHFNKRNALLRRNFTFEDDVPAYKRWYKLPTKKFSFKVAPPPPSYDLSTIESVAITPSVASTATIPVDETQDGEEDEATKKAEEGKETAKKGGESKEAAGGGGEKKDSKKPEESKKNKAEGSKESLKKVGGSKEAPKKAEGSKAAKPSLLEEVTPLGKDPNE